MRPYVKRRANEPANPLSDQSWSVMDLMKFYKWPSNLAGGGKIAIVELGGTYYEADTLKFCQEMKIPVPNVSNKSVGPLPSKDPDADGEVALDVQIAAAAYSAATGQPADITIYWASDIASGLDAADADLMDVFSCSWGADEAEWGMDAVLKMEQYAARASSRGMVIFAAAGDNDSADGGPGAANVDAPASCPHVIGCGGTRAYTYPNKSVIETVWNDNPGQTNGTGTGGGYSVMFPPENWQAGCMAGPGRMVPDVAANADPVTGYRIVVNGQWEVLGGTSAVAPLYSGLFAAFGRGLFWVTPELWKNHLAFNLITSGDNGAFRASSLPSPTCGLGSPNGERLASLMGAMHNP